MATYKPLNIQGGKPKSLTKVEEEELEVELLSPEDDPDFDPFLGLKDDDDEEFDDDVKWENQQDEDDEEEYDEDEDEEGEAEEEEEDDFEDSDDDEEEEDEEEEDVYEARGPRENERIRSLIEQNKRTEQLLQKEREQRIAAQKRELEIQKNTVESGKKILKSNIESLKRNIATARNEGNTESELDLQEELQKAQLDLLSLESWEAPEFDVEAEMKKVNTPKETPESVANWLSANSWFKTPATPEERRKQREAIAYSEILASEGYSMESKEFFNMIDERLEKLGLADKESNDVDSKKKSKKASSKKRRKKKSKKKISQTVQSGSRTSRTSRKNSKKVSLTPEQQEIADLYGMTYLEYAKELRNIEESKKQGKRMTTLKLD